MGDSPGLGTATDATLSRDIKAKAYALGFDLCGIATLGEARSFPAFERWLALGREGEMSYMARYVDQRRDRRLVHPGATSAVVVGMAYGGREPAGPIARYARGEDYHVVMRDRLRALHAWLEQATGQHIDARPYVDTAPILERDLAREAGLGWVGKNTNLINPRIGSHFFLGSLFVELALVPDAPFELDRCGSCQRCIDACPTSAIVAPRELDARRCVSYLTIEHRGDIPEQLRPLIGDLLYGCDICQDVCPWNVKFAKELPSDSAYAARPELAGKDARTLALDFLAMTPDAYATTFRNSAIKRAKLSGLKRNAAVVLGNVTKAGDSDARGASERVARAQDRDR